LKTHQNPGKKPFKLKKKAKIRKGKYEMQKLKKDSYGFKRKQFNFTKLLSEQRRLKNDSEGNFIEKKSKEIVRTRTRHERVHFIKGNLV